MTFLLLLVLLTLSGFFAASETALTVASKAKLHQLAKENYKSAVLARELQSKPGHIIGSMLAGNTLLNVMIASIATSWFMHIVDSRMQTLTSFCIGTIILIYSEALPKMIALEYAEMILVYTAPLLKWISYFFIPLNNVVNSIARLTLKFIKFKSVLQNRNEQEDLRSYIDLHVAENADMAEAKAMLTSVLDLSEILVNQIMVHRKNVQMLNADHALESIIEIISASPYTRFPVWQNNPDNIVGILHVKALLQFLISKKDVNHLRLLDLTHEPWFVPESTDLLEQLRAFRFKQEHFALVVDEYGMFKGIVTLEDILEEIVGDITDEYDIKVGEIMRCADGSCVASGRCSVRDLNRQFGWELSDEDASTVAGLIIHIAQKIPHVGEVYVIQDIRFEILKKQKNYVALIKVSTV